MQRKNEIKCKHGEFQNGILGCTAFHKLELESHAESLGYQRDFDSNANTHTQSDRSNEWTQANRDTDMNT